MIAQALELAPADRLDIIEKIWDSLDPVFESTELSDELRVLLDTRLAEHQADPQDVISWEETKKSILGR